MPSLPTVLLALVLRSAACRGDVFNWPTTPAWTPGSPTIGNSDTVDYSSTGQAISVTLTNTGAAWNGGHPQVYVDGSGWVNGGNLPGSGVNGLILQPISQTSTATYVQVTINFTNPLGANNVSFQLWDIDAQVDGSGNGYVDTISNIQATAVGGGTVFPTTLNAVDTNYAVISGNGAVGLQPAANNTAQGTINIGFSQTVSSITFQYGNGASGALGGQTMGIGPITFTPVPEVNSSNAALVLCGGVMGLGVLRRRSRRAESSHCPPSA